MTDARKRAEALAKSIYWDKLKQTTTTGQEAKDIAQWVLWIHRAIEEAQAEARQEEHDRIREQHAKDLLAAHAEGFRAAQEKAAEIAEQHECERPIHKFACNGEIADRIRKLEP